MVSISAFQPKPFHPPRQVGFGAHPPYNRSLLSQQDGVMGTFNARSFTPSEFITLTPPSINEAISAKGKLDLSHLSLPTENIPFVNRLPILRDLELPKNLDISGIKIPEHTGIEMVDRYSWVVNDGVEKTAKIGVAGASYAQSLPSALAKGAGIGSIVGGLLSAGLTTLAFLTDEQQIMRKANMILPVVIVSLVCTLGGGLVGAIGNFGRKTFGFGKEAFQAIKE